MKNRERYFHKMNEADFIVMLQSRIAECMKNNERFCIMCLLGEIEPCIRCTKYNMNCKECIYAWLNEEK